MRFLYLFSSILLLTVVFFPQTSLAFCTDSVDAKYRDAAEYMFDQGVLKGYPDGSCQLNKSINRAEALTFTLRWSIGAEDLASVEIPSGIRNLHDFADGQWWTAAAAKAYELGILKGDSNGYIRPGDQVIFVENLAMGMRAAYGVTNIPASGSGQQWYQSMLDAAKNNSITTYDPAKKLTRGEVVQMLFDLDNRYHDVDQYFSSYSSSGSSSTATPEPTPYPSTPTPVVSNNTSSNSGPGYVLRPGTSLPFRVLVENLAYLSAEQVAQRVREMNQTELLQMSIYSAFGSWVHYAACQADSSIVMDLGGTQANCTYTAQQWQNTLYFSGGNWDQALSYAKQQQGDLMIAIKCSTGEIDSGSCSVYAGALSNYNNMTNQTTQEIIDNFGAGSCDSPGSYLPDGSYCAPRS